MADIRINALATTAASTASDDFIAVDGSANGTRKLNAYSPTFGGNLTVSGTGTSSVAGTFGIGTASTLGTLNVATPNLTYGTVYLNGATTTADFMRLKSTGADGVFGIESSGGGTILTGSTANSTVLYSVGATALHLGTSGTTRATLTSGGNFLLGTTTDGGQKLQVNGGSIYSTSSSATPFIANWSTTGLFGAYRIERSGTAKAYIGLDASDNLWFGDGAVNTLLTIAPTTGNATFAGDIKLGAGKVVYFDGGLNTYIQGSSGTLFLGTNGSSSLSIDSSKNATFAGKVTVNGRDMLVNAAGPRMLWKDTSNTQDLWQASVDNDSTQGWNLINNTSGYGTVMRFSRLGALRLNNYGAGTLSTDASGNVTASSDARLKTNLRTFARGLADVLKLAPKTYNWNETSGMDTDNDYVGFVAQDVQSAIPEAVYEGKDANKTLTLNDRAILAALVNAVKELNAKLA